MRGLKLMSIVWPAFLSACLMQMVVFALIDPNELQWAGQQLSWSRQAVYAGGFFLFWAGAMLSSALTTLLAPRAPKEGAAGPPSTTTAPRS